MTPCGINPKPWWKTWKLWPAAGATVFLLTGCGAGIDGSSSGGSASCLLNDVGLNDGYLMAQVSNVPSCAAAETTLANLDFGSYWQQASSGPGEPMYEACGYPGLVIWDNGGDVSSTEANSICATIQQQGGDS